MVTGSTIAISYARYSSTGQGEGDSLRRQIEAAESYAAKNGLVIDDGLSFTDEGFSAYDKSNIRKGALGLFLKSVLAGRIPVGATLIVESFDRLSRAAPLEALGVFTDIINAGLTVVALTDPPKKYSRESIHDNVFQLFEVLIDSHRAHMESVRKGELISGAWADKKRRAQVGEIMSRRAPHWISVSINENLHKKDPSKRKATLNADRVGVVMRLIESAEQGVGNNTLIRQLHSDRVPAWSKSGKWQPSYVQKILRNPALFGAVELDGALFEGYYPALIDKDRFLRLQVLRSARATTKVTSRGGNLVTNLFSGRLKCGYCGSAINVAGYKSRKTGYERKYVGCHGARIGSPEAQLAGCRMHIWFIDQLEPKLLLWLTSLDYKALMNTDRSAAEKEKAHLAGLENKLPEVARRIDNITKQVEEGGGTNALIVRQRELEREVEEISKLVKLQRDKVVMVEFQENSGHGRMDALIKMFREMRKLRDDADQLQLRSLREKISASIAQTVNQIFLFPVGPTVKGDRSQRFMIIELKNGTRYEVDDSDEIDDSDSNMVTA